jgi:hypothetical protein
MNMMGRKYTMKRNYLMHLIQLVVILTSIWISLQATQAATTWNVPSNYATIAAAIASVSVVDGDTIEVAAGTYAENITINKSLVLQGVGATTTTISGTATTGTGATIVTITAPNVTVTGFKITNLFSKYGINVANRSGVTITNNTITAIGGSDTTYNGNTFGIAVSSSSAAVANMTITNNTISNISNANGGSLKSANGIVIGFSTGASDITNLLIQGNAISGITAGKGAYGILLNHASGAGANTGRTVSPQILDNTISNLNGLWAHGIGLEGGTPNAVVQGNNISNLTLTPSTGTDAAAITLESNASANTVTIASNSFTGVLLGVLNITAANPLVTVGSNWWGCTAGANGGAGCAATYPTTGLNAVSTGTSPPCTNSACILAVSAPIIDLHSSGRAAIFATESLSK